MWIPRLLQRMQSSVFFPARKNVPPTIPLRRRSIWKKEQKKRGRENRHKIKKELVNIGKSYIYELLKLVPVTGLEPVRCRQRWILSPLRLPFHHTGSYISNGHPQKGHGEIGGPFRRSIKKLLDIQFPKSIAMQLLSLTAAVRDELDFESATSTISSHRQVPK